MRSTTRSGSHTTGHHIRHAHWRSFKTWLQMWQRCTNEKSTSWPNYGGRGISVCDRWRDFAVFLFDMGDRPAGTTLDRVNNDGDYTRENCRWATTKEQRRNASTNVYLTHNGRTACVADWAAEIGCPPATLHYRLKQGWPDDRVISQPIEPRKEFKRRTPSQI